MLEDIEIYKDINRNDDCPCESGKKFKKCCMKEYREARKSSKSAGAKISCFTPIPSLDKDFKERFTEFYTHLMTFSHQYKNKSDTIFIDDIEQNIQQFILEEREYFYENSQEIIDSYIDNKNPNDDEMEILDSLRDGRLDRFFLISKDKESAVIMDEKENLYNIKALHSPFDEVFNLGKKYLTLHTVLIPYKDCYITDGIYGGGDTTKEMDKYFDQLPYQQPAIIYNKNNNITNIPLVLNFAIGTASSSFEKMEELILNRIPQDFGKSFLKLFENSYSYREQLILSFLRSTDLSKDLNCDEGDETFELIIGGTPTMSFELNGNTDTISSDILQRVYKQKLLKESASKSVYANIQKNKKSLFKNQMIQSSFYTMLGVIHVDEDKVDDLIEFLKTFNEKAQREKIMTGFDNLLDELSDEIEIDIGGVYLGCGIDLDFIYHDIDNYRDYISEYGALNFEDMKKYAFRD